MPEAFAPVILQFLLKNGYYLFGLFLAMVVVRLWWHKGLLNSDPNVYAKSRIRAKRNILKEKWAQRYTYAVRWLNHLLSRRWIGDYYYHARALQQHLRLSAAFTVESYEFCFKLAFVYPILAFLLAWVLGGDGRLGELAMMDGEMPGWQRLLTLFVLLLSFSLFFLAYRLSGWKLLVAFTFANVFAITITITITIAFDSVILFAVTLIVLIVVAVIFKWLYGRSRQNRSLFWLGYSLLYVLLSFIILNWIDDGGIGLIVLFCLLLPSFNAPVDWLSLGFTRYLLQRLQFERGWLPIFWWALADLVLALFFLSLITLVLVAVVAVADGIAMQPVVDLPMLFSQLRNTPNDPGNIWIYFILLSTLLPTLVHFALVGGALTRMAPHSWRKKMVADMDEDEHYAKAAWLYISIVPAVGYVLVPSLLLSLLYAIVSTHGGTLGFALLDAAEWWAGVVDASFL